VRAVHLYSECVMYMCTQNVWCVYVLRICECIYILGMCMSERSTFVLGMCDVYMFSECVMCICTQ